MKEKSCMELLKERIISELEWRYVDGGVEIGTFNKSTLSLCNAGKAKIPSRPFIPKSEEVIRRKK